MARRVRIVVGLAVGATLVAVLAIAFRDPPIPPLCREHPQASEDGMPVNVVRQLRTADEGYELELWSQEPFPMRAMPTVLRVGAVDVGRSRFVEDGLTSIVFLIASEDYARMATGDPILVHHTFIPEALEENPNLAGNVIATNGGNLWTFGRFDKSQLDCPPLGIDEPAEA